MSTPNNMPRISHERSRRRLNRAISATALSALAIGVGSAGLKVKHETDKYNSRVHAAQKAYKPLANAAKAANYDLTTAQYDAKVSEMQQTIDNLEEGKLPPVKKDGKLIGYETVYGFNIPEHISEEQRAKIHRLGKPLTPAEIKGWDKEYAREGSKFDPDYMVKVDANIYVDKAKDQVIRFVPLDKMDKFLALCQQLDVAHKMALPGYEQDATQAQTAAGISYEHLQHEAQDKSDWVAFQ
jgi:hypothetical protein